MPAVSRKHAADNVVAEEEEEAHGRNARSDKPNNLQ
jgi:hypothetical protein